MPLFAIAMSACAADEGTMLARHYAAPVAMPRLPGSKDAYRRAKRHAEACRADAGNAAAIISLRFAPAAVLLALRMLDES